MKKLLLLFIIAIAPAAFAQNKADIPYTLQPRTFFENQVSLPVPTSFAPAEESLVKTLYPDEKNRPKIILTDKTDHPLLALNIAPNTGDRETLVKFYRDTKNDLREKYPSQQFLRSDVIHGRTLAVIEVILPNSAGQKVYNMMAFSYVGKNFFFFNFSCPEEDMPKWQNTAREMAENIKVMPSNQ